MTPRSVTPRSVVSPPSSARTEPDGPHRSGGRRVPGGTPMLLAICVVLAAASLAVPAAIGFDPWAWLVWGRQVLHGGPSTAGGPSWKPLPVLVTTALAPFPSVAPQLWLIVARAGGLFGLVLVFRLAARFAGPAAGGIAGAAYVLTPGDEARWLRLMLQGNVEPLLVGLCLWAVERHLDGRRGQVVLIAGVAALLRPEVWPFLVLYAAWLVWRQRAQWRVTGPVVAAVPLLWFGGDWWASGGAWTGAERAQVFEQRPLLERLGLASESIVDAVIAPVWVAAAVCLAWAFYRRLRPLVVLGCGALVWMAVVAGMTVVFGYAALGRFLAPAAALLCVLAGVATVWVVTCLRRAAGRAAVAAALLVVTVPFAAGRVGWVATTLSSAAAQDELADGLDRVLAAAGGRGALLGCGALVIDTAQDDTMWLNPALSWKLGVPLARTQYDLNGRSGIAIARTGGSVDRQLSATAGARSMVRMPVWTVYAVRCPANGR